MLAYGYSLMEKWHKAIKGNKTLQVYLRKNLLLNKNRILFYQKQHNNFMCLFYIKTKYFYNRGK